MPRRAGAYLVFLVLSAAVVFGDHWPYYSLPYFWDEHGQFIPAALDILNSGWCVPRSTVPNVHPPGVMAYLALVWRLAGYSIPAARAAMLALGALTLFFSFLLAIRLTRRLPGAPAFTAAALLAADPLFYTQSMLAQLDMPAMLFSTLALLLFLEERYAAAAFACVALVLAKETGVVLPLLFTVMLLLRSEWKRAAFFLPSFAVLALWLLILWRATGNLLGDTGFAHYNVSYPLNPVRLATAAVRRGWFLFFSDFRWIGAAAIVIALRKSALFRTPEWRITGLFAAAHVLLVSVFGGASLERYLLPVLPALYAAVAAGFSLWPGEWRLLAAVSMTLGLAAGLFWNPPYPFPYENNLAMVDFVRLHQSAAQVLEANFAGRTIYTAWPLTAALRRSDFGYVHQPLRTIETSDLRVSTLSKLDPNAASVLVLYSRTWEPEWSLLKYQAIEEFLRRFYDYDRQMDSSEVRRHFGMRGIARWEQRGQWVEIYARPERLRSDIIPVNGAN